MWIMDFLYGERAEKLVAKKMESVLKALRYEDTTKAELAGVKPLPR